MAKGSKKKRAVSKAKKVKAHTRKITSSKIKTSPKKIKRTPAERNIDRALTNNFIALQKVMVNLATKFDSLSNQISKLLELFEIAAKSLAKKDFELNTEKKDTKEILEKLDNISQQAGLIGKGLVLIHEVSSEIGGKNYAKGYDERPYEMAKAIPPESQPLRRPVNPNLMMPSMASKQMQHRTEKSSPRGMQGYQKSSTLGIPKSETMHTESPEEDTLSKNTKIE